MYKLEVLTQLLVRRIQPRVSPSFPCNLHRSLYQDEITSLETQILESAFKSSYMQMSFSDSRGM